MGDIILVWNLVSVVWRIITVIKWICFACSIHNVELFKWYASYIQSVAVCVCISRIQYRVKCLDISAYSLIYYIAFAVALWKFSLKKYRFERKVCDSNILT